MPVSLAEQGDSGRFEPGRRTQKEEARDYAEARILEWILDEEERRCGPETIKFGCVELATKAIEYKKEIKDRIWRWMNRNNVVWVNTDQIMSPISFLNAGRKRLEFVWARRNENGTCPALAFLAKNQENVEAGARRSVEGEKNGICYCSRTSTFGDAVKRRAWQAVKKLAFQQTETPCDPIGLQPGAVQILK
jgi:hypothetical protein